MRWILIAPLAVLLVLFAVANRQEVQVGLWPLDVTWSTPLAVAVLAISALFFLLGAAIAGAAAWPHRRRARRLEEAGRLLEAQVAELKAREARTTRALPALAGPVA